ncbi:MAG: DNA polymerase III subunit delta, partial [Alphaproteobacteria bacterium]|nr:DNA polymerase III subunit delta [Alphaproteobacteria bacterium]
MKAKPYQVNALVSQIKNGFKGALVFGPDFGIVQELADQIISFIITDKSDEFCFIKLTPQKIKEIPSFLSDEGNAISLMRGRKLIWLKEADNTVLSAVEEYFQNIKTDTFLLITAGNLTKSSGIRNLFETEKDLLGIACYADEAKDVAAFVQEVLSNQQIRVSEAALPILTERLTENRLMTRRELEKLINYLGDKKIVEPADVLAVITDTQNSSTDIFCCAVAVGNRQTADKEYHLMLENGENPVSIIRILSMYFNKLLDASETYLSGGTEAALKKIMKPAQFRLESSFRKQIQIWKKPFILKVLDLLIEAEKQAKSTGLPAELILDRVILKISG